MDRNRLVIGLAAAAVLTLGAATAVVAQHGSLPGGEDEPVITGTVAAPGEREAAEGTENGAAEGKDSDESPTGSSAQQAADAALRARDGNVLEVEQGDDPGAAYEVEIRKADGSVAEVLLDGDFNVIGQETGD
jgi:hypothetical protein